MRFGRRLCLLRELDTAFGEFGVLHAIEDAKKRAEFGRFAGGRDGGFEQAAFEEVFGGLDEFFVVVAGLSEDVFGLFFEHLALLVEFVSAVAIEKGVEGSETCFDAEAANGFGPRNVRVSLPIGAHFEDVEDLRLRFGGQSIERAAGKPAERAGFAGVVNGMVVAENVNVRVLFRFVFRHKLLMFRISQLLFRLVCHTFLLPTRGQSTNEREWLAIRST